MSQQLYDAPAIISINSIDNANSDQQLITVTSLASVSVTPVYAKLIVDNITTNALCQKVINLGNSDFSLSGTTFTIKLLMDIDNFIYKLEEKTFIKESDLIQDDSKIKKRIIGSRRKINDKITQFK